MKSIEYWNEKPWDSINMFRQDFFSFNRMNKRIERVKNNDKKYFWKFSIFWHKIGQKKFLLLFSLVQLIFHSIERQKFVSKCFYFVSLMKSAEYWNEKPWYSVNVFCSIEWINGMNEWKTSSRKIPCMRLNFILIDRTKLIFIRNFYNRYPVLMLSVN